MLVSDFWCVITVMSSGFVFGLANGYAKRKESTAKVRSFVGRSSCWCFHEASSSHLKTTPAIPSTLIFHCRPCKCCSTIAQVCLFCPMVGDGKLKMWWDHVFCLIQRRNAESKQPLALTTSKISNNNCISCCV